MGAARPALPWLWPFDHSANALRIEWLAALVVIAGIFEPDADLTVTEAPGFTLQPTKSTPFGNHQYLSGAPPYACRPRHFC